MTCAVNERDHLTLAELDLVELANLYGTPLWLIDEQTIRQAVLAVKSGLSVYPHSQVFYAGKAFLCLAICHLLKQLEVGLDVVSEGELFTAIQASFPADRLLLHGNNKSAKEIESALTYGDVRIVVDSHSELKMVAQVASQLGRRARILLRMIPAIDSHTHPHLNTGQSKSKFGIPITDLDPIASFIRESTDQLDFIGLHAHIGSGISEPNDFLALPQFFAELVASLQDKHQIAVKELNLGGGVDIAYTEEDKTIALGEWSQSIAKATLDCFQKRGLDLPHLFLEPGRSIIGPAGMTLYRVGHIKHLPDGTILVALDGGMADNPRPITYEAAYTAVIANRASALPPEQTRILVGKYCEQGDILVKEAPIAPESGEIVALFGTGAYNYSQSSNYNRTGRPACLIVYKGKAELILERESNEDLLSQDRIPPRLLS